MVNNMEIVVGLWIPQTAPSFRVLNALSLARSPERPPGRLAPRPPPEKAPTQTQRGLPPAAPLVSVSCARVLFLWLAAPSRPEPEVPRGGGPLCPLLCPLLCPASQNSAWQVSASRDVVGADGCLESTGVLGRSRGAPGAAPHGSGAGEALLRVSVDERCPFVPPGNL